MDNFYDFDDIFIKKKLNESFERDILKCKYDKFYKYHYSFNLFFLIDYCNKKIILNKIKYDILREIIFFTKDVLKELRKSTDEKYFLYGNNSEKFIVTKNNDIIYVSNYDTPKLYDLLDKLNSNENIKIEDTQGHGNLYFIGNTKLCEEYYDNNDNLLCNKFFIF